MNTLSSLERMSEIVDRRDEHIATLEARVKAADDALFIAIQNKQNAEEATRRVEIALEKQTNLVPSFKACIALLTARVKELEEQPNMAKVKELEGDLAEIKVALQPQCCHVTGMHNPTHFRKDPTTFCGIQKSEAWERASEIIGGFPVAISATDCGWCHREKHK